MRIKCFTITMLVILLSLAACSNQNVSPTSTEREPITQNPTDTTPENTPSMEDAYPSIPEQPMAYPITEDPYPISEEDLPEQGPTFTIDEPVNSDETNVTGTGPQDVPIRLVDVSSMGNELAITTITEDGTFEFELDEPLIVGHFIGLMIGDLENTDFNYDEFIYSNEYIDKPMIGILFDMVQVLESN